MLNYNVIKSANLPFSALSNHLPRNKQLYQIWLTYFKWKRIMVLWTVLRYYGGLFFFSSIKPMQRPRGNVKHLLYPEASRQLFTADINRTAFTACLHLMPLTCDTVAWNADGGQEVLFRSSLIMPMFCFVYGFSNWSNWKDFFIEWLTVGHLEKSAVFLEWVSSISHEVIKTRMLILN